VSEQLEDVVNQNCGYISFGNKGRKYGINEVKDLLSKSLRPNISEQLEDAVNQNCGYISFRNK
jgi:hypothetical protein